MDGRSVYNPITSGVSGTQQDVPLEDIERIEVIRGPGGTVWGANADEWRHQHHYQECEEYPGRDGRRRRGLGNNRGWISSIWRRYRLGGSLSGVRQIFDIDSSTLPAGGSAQDGWQSVHGGFRSDWVLSPNDTMTVQGDLQEGREGQNLTALDRERPASGRNFHRRFDTSAGNILGRWNHILANGSEMSLQIYDDHSRTPHWEPGSAKYRGS